MLVIVRNLQDMDTSGLTHRESSKIPAELLLVFAS